MEYRFIKRISVYWQAALAFYLLLFFSGIAMANNECFPLQGKFKSKTLSPDECSSSVGFCTQGVLSGGLSGDYDFVAQQFIPANEPSVTAVNFYTGFSHVYTKRGELMLTDTGALNLASGKISSLLTITGGSGDFELATGYLYIYGKSIAAENKNVGRYKGEICIVDNNI